MLKNVHTLKCSVFGDRCFLDCLPEMDPVIFVLEKKKSLKVVTVKKYRCASQLVPYDMEVLHIQGPMVTKY